MMDCKNCTKASVYNADPVPFVAHENMRAQMDSANRRLIRLLTLTIILFVASVAYNIYMRTEYETIHIKQGNERGVNNFIGNDGDIYNGESGNYLP